MSGYGVIVIDGATALRRLHGGAAVAAAVSRRAPARLLPGIDASELPSHGVRGPSARLHRTLGTGGALILGADRPKDVATPLAAYDDRKGVTAAFNLNSLAWLSRELDADVALARICHRAFYATGSRRAEMHLESVVDLAVHVAGVRVRFAHGETIRTESAYG